MYRTQTPIISILILYTSLQIEMLFIVNHKMYIKKNLYENFTLNCILNGVRNREGTH